jgi:hypothetical protein
MTETVLEIRGHRTLAHRHEQPRVHECLLARHFAIELAERSGACRARSRDCLEAETRHDRRRGAVPDVRYDEDTGVVQGAEARGLLVLVVHAQRSQRASAARFPER